MTMLAETHAQMENDQVTVGAAGLDARLDAAGGRRVLRSRAERDAVRPEVTEATPDRVVSSGYTTGSRVRLGAAVDVPLTVMQSGMADRLFALHGARLVRYVLRRMIRPDVALAEDIAQDVWVGVCRQIDRLMEEGRSDDELFPLLAGRAKHAISEHFRVARNGETAMQDTDLAAVADAEAATAAEPVAQEFSPRYAEAIATLPEDLRTVVHLRFELGMTFGAIAARTGWHQMTVTQRVRRAELLLTPLVTGGTVETEQSELPDGYELVLDQLADSHRAIVRLRAEGLTYSQIAARLGRHVPSVRATGRQAIKAVVAALRSMGHSIPDPVAARRPLVLPDGWESVLDVLDERRRAIVCLRADGLGHLQVAGRLGIDRSRAAQLWRDAVRMLTLALARQAAA